MSVGAWRQFWDAQSATCAACMQDVEAEQVRVLRVSSKLGYVGN